MLSNLRSLILAPVIWFQLEYPRLFHTVTTVVWRLEVASLSSMGSTFWPG